MKRFWPYFKLLVKVRGAFAAALFFGLVFGLASGFGLPFMAQKVFPILFGGQQVSSWMLIGSLLLLPGVFALRGISGFLNTYLINHCGTYVLNELRKRVFQKLQVLPMTAYQNHSTGDLLTRSASDTQILQTTLMGVSNDLVKYPITLLGACGAVIYMSLVNSQLVFILVLLGIIPLCVFPIRILGKLLRKRAHDQQRQSATVTDILNENIRGVREVRLYNQEGYQFVRFTKAIETLRKYVLKIVKYHASLSPIIEFISAVGVSLAIYYAYQAQLKLEVVLPLIMALYMAYEPMKKLGEVHNNIRKGGASLERIESLLNEPVNIVESLNPVLMERAKGDIKFEDVSFRYPKAHRDALSKFSAEIPAGMVVGVVGPSGAGKTTLLNLLPRLFEQHEGKITIDGVDTRGLSLKDLRKQIAVVPQESFLFNDTVAANIAFGDPEATMEKIMAAAQRAQAHKFIESLPLGYETLVGEAGGMMSGGQRQRLAIARAFYKNAPILLLDEPTSALDAEHESEIFASLKELAAGRTSLIVSHRLKSLHFCHKIIYIEEGNLVAVGTHEELLSSCGGYRKLYSANDLA